jgi:hypothetical protein
VASRQCKSVLTHELSESRLIGTFSVTIDPRGGGFASDLEVPTLGNKNIVYSILMKQNDRSLSDVQLSFEPTNRAGTTLSCKAVEVRESLS